MKRKTVLFVVVVLGLVLVPIWAQEGGELEVYGPRTHFESDPKPVEAVVSGNPLDWAGARIGMDVRNFELPRGHEGAYRFAARFPIIDFVSLQPLYMKKWAEENGQKFVDRQGEGPLGLPHGLTVLRGEPAMPSGGSPAKAEVVRAVEEWVSATPFSKPYKSALKHLLWEFCSVHEGVRAARAGLTEEDLKFFRANPGYYIAPDGKKMPSLTGSTESHFRFLERARRVRFEHLFFGAAQLHAAVAAYVKATKKMKGGGFFAKGAPEKGPWKFSTPAGEVLIGGCDRDRHGRDVAFAIDLGGDDVWTSNAGGCSSAELEAALCIDHGGNDRYEAPKRNFVQGFGFLGVGYLADLGGTDIYVARHFCQGAGILGTGCLWDLGGDDRYEAHAFCQGAGMFGLGALFDDEGEDFYDCATLGQGGATTMGLGVLCDLAGDDRYHLNVGPGKDRLGNLAGYGQGGGVSFRNYPWRGKLTPYGGAGLLVDGAGNDRYRTKGWCDQGGSYLMSLGALVDLGGNDHYTAGTGQGSGIHVTNAILVDKSGHDVYEGGFRTGGSGGDRSPGFLIDYEGNDIYKAKRACYGTGCKPYSYSLFIDYKGDDLYIGPNPKGAITMNNWDSFGGVWPESSPDLWPYAICMDLGGKDEYRVRNRANGAVRHSFGHGIHIDMEWRGGDVILNPRCPLKPFRGLALPEAVRATPFGEAIGGLTSGDTFMRFQAVGRIVTGPAEIVPILCAAILESEHRAFNRDVMECIHYFLVNGKADEKGVEAICSLLKARDAEVRVLTADNAGVFGLKAAEKSLLAALTDSSAQVRRFALRSLRSFESSAGKARAEKLLFEDPSRDVRREAIIYVDRVQGDSGPFPLLARALSEASPSSIRVFAAEALGRGGDERAIPLLRKAAKSFDVYVQRAAGKGLADLGEV
ncbi:MAG: HEAT repeat domain-containing protein, partial [Planctomycetota bacterium]